MFFSSISRLSSLTRSADSGAELMMSRACQRTCSLRKSTPYGTPRCRERVARAGRVMATVADGPGSGHLSLCRRFARLLSRDIP